MDSPEDHPESRWQRGLRWISGGLLAFLVYALSLGPLARVYPTEWALPPALQAFYSPLLWLAARTDTIGLLDGYLVWWRELY